MVLGAAELTVGATRRDREYLRAQPQDLRICGIQNEHGLRADLSSELKSGPAHSWQFAVDTLNLSLGDLYQKPDFHSPLQSYWSNRPPVSPLPTAK